MLDDPESPTSPVNPLHNPASTSAITAAGAVPGYLATPNTSGPWPAVVVVHEIFGLNDDIRRIADRFAAAGYLAFAPDLMAMGSRIACLVSVARSLVSGRGRDVDRLLALRDWLAGQPGCTGQVGIAGFCLGGGFAILLANQGFDASSVAYGRLPRNLSAALAGSCPMVASYGGRDGSLPGAAAKLEAGLIAAGVDHDVKEYPEAGHSFLNNSNGRMPAPMRPMLARMHAGYVDTAAADAWTRILAMFDRALTTQS
jgi:carboxymethylenebutenolidase